jgi:hypothetical protein
MKKSFLKGFIILVILLFFSGLSFSAEGGPAVWLFSAQPDRYFPAFFEIHLKRLFSASQLQSINLYSKHPDELKKKINSKMGLVRIIILMDFSKELTDCFLEECEKIAFHEKPFIITWNCDQTRLPDFFYPIPIIINWETVFDELKTVLPRPPFPIFLAHQNEHFFQNFLQSFQNHFHHQFLISDSKSHQMQSSQAIYFVSNEQFIKEYLSISHSLICLEASTFTLAEIQSGTILAAIDFKPSKLASQIQDLLFKKPIKPNLTLTPLLILPKSLPEADAYEVLRRCFLCGNN